MTLIQLMWTTVGRQSSTQFAAATFVAFFAFAATFVRAAGWLARAHALQLVEKRLRLRS